MIRKENNDPTEHSRVYYYKQCPPHVPCEFLNKIVYYFF